MTNIEIFKDKNYYFGFIAKDHADSGEYESIVCAGISALTSTLYFYLLEICNISESNLLDEDGSGYLKVEILNKDLYKNKKVQNCFEFMFLGLSKIEKSYPEYLTLEILEV